MTEAVGLFFVGAAFSYAYNEWLAVRVAGWAWFGFSVAASGLGDATIDGSAWNTLALIAGVVAGGILWRKQRGER